MEQRVNIYSMSLWRLCFTGRVCKSLVNIEAGRGDIFKVIILKTVDHRINILFLFQQQPFILFIISIHVFLFFQLKVFIFHRTFDRTEEQQKAF